jgi:signal transduction histidine kinase
LIERKIKRVAAPVRDSIEELLEVARTEIQRLDSIIHQFLQAIRPTRPLFELHDLNEIIEESVAFLRREIEDRDILLETDLASGLPRVEIDRNQMKQAFYNVIKNAFEAMQAGGILHIRSWRDDNFVSIAFVDSGGGLSAENMSNLFRPYFTTKSSGSGLGLLIVRRIVREHGGEIEIESNEGKGVRVTIHLPYGERRTRLLSDRNEAASESGESMPDAEGQSIE